MKTRWEVEQAMLDLTLDWARGRKLSFFMKTLKDYLNALDNGVDEGFSDWLEPHKKDLLELRQHIQELGNRMAAD